MRTKWRIDYLNRKYGNHVLWANRKRKEFSDKTGLHWSWWTQQANVVFSPSWKGLKARGDKSVEGKLLKIGNRGISFLDAHRRTGVPLKTVIEVSKYLVVSQKATVIVGRTGYAAGYKSKRIFNRR